MIDVTTLPVWAKDTLRSAQTTRGLGLPRKQTGRYTKKTRYGRGSEASIQSLQGQLEQNFWEEEKAIAPVIYYKGGPMQPRQF
jgi:hypothetical protein